MPPLRLKRYLITGLLTFLPLWVTVLADIGITLLVTLNGMRAMRFQPA